MSISAARRISMELGNNWQYQQPTGGLAMKEKRNRKDRKETPEEPVPNKTKLSDLFDIPRAALSGVMQIELSDNTEALVDGCLGVLEYDENYIRLAGKKMSVCFAGRGLQIKILTHDSAVIAGFITKIEFIN
jgi:sporulation protein YqfC